MSLLKIFNKNCFNNFILLLFVYTIICVILWSSGFHITNSSAELMNFDIQNQTLESNNFIGRYLMARSFRNLNAIKQNYQNTKHGVQKNLHFIYYKNGKVLLQNSPSLPAAYAAYANVIKSCVNEKISFIFHGWTESCYTEWVPQLIERLTFHRGGCIVCVDYSSWSKKSYIELLQKFDPISEILYEEVLQLIQNGFNPSKIFMFGFSYGGQIASKIGRMLKPQYNIKKIDICDMAGPGFDFISYLNHSEAAENIQCYYTSLDKGSHFHSCHQNIRLGQCGYTQPAILSQPYFSSHGLCPRIYINAFDYPFYAFQKSPKWCDRGKTIKNLPNGFTVGYREGGYNDMIGDIFVPTSMNYPYNLSKREMILYEKYLEGT
ncbi:uncharacterized protein LOC111677030 [Lucilia cuprina]|nr:uncharacterized protein LOC111677030 [Lucilia cuprina]